LQLPDTNWYFLCWPPLCSGTHYSTSVSYMSVELFQFMSQLLNLMFIQIFTDVKFAENKQLTVRGRFFFCLVYVHTCHLPHRS
jgi:hypothetical protein